MKNFIKSLACGFCLAFSLFSVDCLELRQMSSNGSNTAPRNESAPTTHVRRSFNPVAGETQVVENADIGESMTAYNPEDDSSCSGSSSEEWVASHKELISRACYDERFFDELIDEISKYSSVAEDRRILYSEIENSWNERNIFGATILDGGDIICCRVQRFDF